MNKVQCLESVPAGIETIAKDAILSAKRKDATKSIVMTVAYAMRVTSAGVMYAMQHCASGATSIARSNIMAIAAGDVRKIYFQS